MAIIEQIAETFINESEILCVVNGQSGLEIPVPISNTEVKQAYVLLCTVFYTGNSKSCLHFSF
jgi:hypothetical protein